MIEKKYREQPKDILKRKIDIDDLLKKVEKGIKTFLESPFVHKNN